MELEEEKEDLKDPGTWEQRKQIRQQVPILKSEHESAENAHKAPGSEKDVKKEARSKKGL